MTKPKLNVRLLRKIQKMILEEPRRLNMWLVQNHYSKRDVDNSEYNLPPCGTVGCIAGWALNLSGFTRSNSLNKAATLLGIERTASDHVFLVSDWPEKFHNRYNDARTQRQKARVTSNRIDYLIKHGE